MIGFRRYAVAGTCMQPERLLLLAGSPKCKALVEMLSLDQRNTQSPEVVDGDLSLAECARKVRPARGPPSPLESEHQGVASRAVGTWSSRDDGEAIWYIHDQLPSDCRGACRACQRSRSTSDCVCRISSSRSATLDRLWKRSAQCREMRMNLDKPTTTSQLDCHRTRKWWRMLSRKSWHFHA